MGRYSRNFLQPACCNPLAFTNHERRKVRSSLRSQIGLPCDKEGTLGFIFGKPMSLPGYWVRRALQTAALGEVKRVPRLCVPAEQVTRNTPTLILSA